jgi:kynurenine formamidase
MKQHMRVFDLTHTLHDAIPSWEEAEGFSTAPLANIATQGYSNRWLQLDEHCGTHLDAPAHLIVNGKTIDRLEPENLVTPLAVIDFRDICSTSPDAVPSIPLFQAWESAHGPLPHHATILLHTGWSERWMAPERYRNADESGILHFPGYSLEAARWLVEERGAVALGIDALSVDRGADEALPVHRYCLAKGVYLLENVSVPSELPATGATLVSAPLKVAGASGAPARLLALVRG